MLIINADDFGLGTTINKAVVKCFREGLCSSATIMPNMPAFEEACQLSHEHSLKNHIGMHLVLQEGMPLTEMIKKFSRFCDEKGHLHLSRRRPIVYLTTAEKEVLATEIRAQIKRCRDSKLPLTHIDSHHHIHTEWAIANVLIDVAREQNIPYVRLSRNCIPNVNLVKSVYKKMLNRKFRSANLARTKYFGSLIDFAFIAKKKVTLKANDSFEIMIHPILNEQNMLVDGTFARDLAKAIQEVSGYQNAVSFTGVKYEPSKA